MQPPITISGKNEKPRPFDFRALLLVSSALLAFSFGIIQELINSKPTDLLNIAFTGCVFAIPFLSANIFLCSIVVFGSGYKHLNVPWWFNYFCLVGIVFAIAGVIYALTHIKPWAGGLFTGSLLLSIVLLTKILVSNPKPDSSQEPK
jgi:hypothetical protein